MDQALLHQFALPPLLSARACLSRLLLLYTPLLARLLP